jgi:hypothetical protein
MQSSHTGRRIPRTCALVLVRDVGKSPTLGAVARGRIKGGRNKQRVTQRAYKRSGPRSGANRNPALDPQT